MCAEHHPTGRRQLRWPTHKLIPGDLFDYADDPAPRLSPPRGSPSHVFDVEKLPVFDDWPENVPITEAEIQVFERWFADFFDEMFGPVDLPDDLKRLSYYDNEKP
ncbi:MAG: hypothetical protein DI528_08755 [Shinella sp.]|nr:MAG: hypothetical protein DI528_08755 [Shinella sp.]